MKTILALVILIFSYIQSYSQTHNEKHKAEQAQEVQHHLKLYPIEADKYVNIYVTYDEPTDFTLTLPGSDMNNEKKWEVKAKMTYQQSLDVSTLPEGTYSIVLNDGKGKEEIGFRVKR